MTCETVYVERAKFNFVCLVVCVDDLLTVVINRNVCNEIKQQLERKYQVKDLGAVAYFLGVKFSTTDDIFRLSQEAYIDELRAPLLNS